MKARFLDADGKSQIADLPLNLYSQANKANMSVPAFLSREFVTDEAKYGSPLQQFMASAGLFSKDDPSLGIKAVTVQEALDGDRDSQFRAQGSTIVYETPASRILFPIATLAAIENKLYQNKNSEIAMFEAMVAQRVTIAGDMYQYPVIDFTRAERGRSSRASQLSEPNLIMTIEASDRMGYIPTYTLGMQISDKAAKATTLDFVAMAMARQAEVEAAERLYDDMRAMHMGDADSGFAALPVTYISEYDSNITTAGRITHLGWLKWLAKNRKSSPINTVWMTLETFLKVEMREGRPTRDTDKTTAPFNERPDVTPILANMTIDGTVRVFIVEEEVLEHDMIVGFDDRFAIRKITNSDAEYRASEALVMRKAESMRWDWGTTSHRLFDWAWSKLSLSVKPA